MQQIAIIILISTIVLGACRKSEYELTEQQLEIINSNLGGTGTTTWTSDTEYLLDGFVFVNPNQTLIIEAGTVIRAKTGQGEKASALIVARGGRIIAKGTKENPIIFTCENDDLEGSIPYYNQGLWGGVIILGNAPVNTSSGEAFIEGIPLGEPRAIYGGDDPDDNSGEFEYVSIRYGGTNIGEGNEINGLTLGGVGKGTNINHIEIISNKDDGLEVFGGTVNLRHIAVAFCGDDAFDFDLGYQGKCQFLLAIQSEQVGDKLAEHDGGINPVEGSPYTIPEIFNATFIGSGSSAIHGLITFQDNGGGKYYNSVFLEQEEGIAIELKNGESSYTRFTENSIDFGYNLFYHIANNTFPSVGMVLKDLTTKDAIKSEEFNNELLTNFNEIRNINLGKNAGDISVYPDSVYYGAFKDYTSDWYKRVKFKGAIDASEDWLKGWSLLSNEQLIK